MSYEAAVGQIDQILQWQQQIADPATATQSSASGGVGLTSAGTGTDTTAFADALAAAQTDSAQQATGMPGTTGETDSSSLLNGGDSQLTSLLASIQGTGSADTSGLYGDSGLAAVTSASGSSDPRVLAMTEEANALVGKPYVWGGGHSGWGAQSGYDCSGFVSAVLHAGGYLTTPQDTTTLPSAAGMQQGPGQYVTVYDRSQPGEDGHVIIEIDGQFYESGGEHAAWGGGGGVESIATPSASYLATFDTILHPAGL